MAGGSMLYRGSQSALLWVAMVLLVCSGSTLWAQNPHIVEDVRAGAGSSDPADLTAVDGRLFFTAEDGVNGRELWLTDIDAGTTVLVDINAGAGSSAPERLTQFGESLLFTADDGAHGREVWLSDTQQGTRLLKDVRADLGSDPRDLLVVDGIFFFTADDGETGRELWISDGTEAGTLPVGDINPGAESSSPEALTALGTTLFFTADDGASGRELWVSDGLEEGTRLLKDINVGPGSSDPLDLTVVGAAVFFTADDGATGRELWVSNSTEGTLLVRDIHLGEDASDPLHLTGAAGALLFTADDGTSGRELWISNGNEAGTEPVEDIHAGAGSSGPLDLTVLAGEVFFSADDGVSGRELWVSDGSAEGTARLGDIQAGPEGSGPMDLTELGDTVVFSADDGVSGRELWLSDGTEGGTGRVKDIHASAGAGPDQLTVTGATLFLSADDGVAGRELWISDGSEQGTARVADVFEGPDGSDPERLTVVGESLFLSADDGLRGRELWVLGLTAPTVEIVSPVDGSIFFASDSIEFEGSALDEEDGDLTSSLTWSSDLDGSLGSGGSFTASLSFGTHVVTAQVTDTLGAAASAQISVTVRARAAVEILSPVSGSSVLGRTPIDFAGSAVDEDGVDLTSSLIWTSDLDGRIGSGGAFTTSLSDGTHAIVAEASDALGPVGSAQIVVTVRPNAAPQVTIFRPAPNLELIRGRALQLSGSATDAEDGDLTAALLWRSNRDGTLGTGGSVRAELSFGVHRITAEARDSVDLRGSEGVTVSVRLNSLPRVSILDPAHRSSLVEMSPVSFRGAAFDDEDGELTAELSWRSDLDGVLGSGSSFSTLLSPGNHTVTASVIDADGATGRRSIGVTVRAHRGPRGVAAVPDIDGLGDDEVAVIEEGDAAVTLFDGGSGLLIRRFPVAGQEHWRPLDVAVLPDVNGNGSAEVAILLRKARKTRVFVKDALTTRTIARLKFARSFQAVDLEAVPDLDGSGSAGIAVLGSRAGVSARVVVKSLEGPAASRTLDFALAQPPLDLEIVEAAGLGSPVLAVLTGGAGERTPRLLLAELANGAVIRELKLDKGLEARDAQIVRAGRAAPEALVVVVGEARNGQVRLVSVAAASGARRGEVALGATHRALGLRAVELDAGLQGLGVLTERRTDGAVRVSVLDSETLAMLGSVDFPELVSPLGFVVLRELADPANPSHGVLAVVGEATEADGAFVVALRDAISGSLLRVIELP